LEWGNGENYFLHYFSPFWAGFIQLFSPFFGHFFPIRRSEAIRIRLPDRKSNRRCPRRTENRKSRGTRTRLLKNGEKSEWRKIMEKNNGEK
jgi:hypothetical protein